MHLLRPEKRRGKGLKEGRKGKRREEGKNSYLVIILDKIDSFRKVDALKFPFTDDNFGC